MVNAPLKHETRDTRHETIDNAVIENHSLLVLLVLFTLGFFNLPLHVVDNLELENEELELGKTRKQMESFKREKYELKKTHEAMQMAVERIIGRTNISDGTNELSDQQASIRQQLLDYKQKLDSTMKELSVVEKSEDKPDSISIESLINLETFDFFNQSLNLVHFNDIYIPGETCVRQQMILRESEEDTQYATIDDI